LDIIQEIQERKKSGRNFKQLKSPNPTPRKKSPKEILNSTKKNKLNPVKYTSDKFSSESLKILNNNNQLKSNKSTDKLNIDNKSKNSLSKLDSGLSELKRAYSEKILNTIENNINDNPKNNHNHNRNDNPKKLNEFNVNINNQPSLKIEKEKAFKRIISIINLEESINNNMDNEKTLNN
jgi:hypothetical protein